MKKRKILSLTLALVMILVLFSACSAHTTLVCDGCGISFTAREDYSLQLAEDADLEALYGIDMYQFYCPDCNDPRATEPLAVSSLFPEDVEKVREYRNNKP